MAAKTGQPNRSRPHHGFTLLETLVAMVIFGIITVSLSLAFSVALQSQQTNTTRFEESGSVRIVMDTLTRDIEQAYASAQNPACVFIAGSDQGGAANSSNISSGLLTLTTRSNRINAPYAADPNDPNSQNGQSGPTLGNTTQDNNDTTPPQSDPALVRYDLDPQSGVLQRTVFAIPNLQYLSQNASGGPETVLANNIVSLTLRFWDTSQQNWRTDWDYEQQNQPSSPVTAAAATTTGTGATAAGTAGGTQGTTPASGSAAGGTATAGSGTTGQTGVSAGTSNTQTTSASGGTVSGDPALPGAVEITLVLKRSDGSLAHYQTVVPIQANLPQDGVAPLTNPPTTTQTGTSR